MAFRACLLTFLLSFSIFFSSAQSPGPYVVNSGGGSATTSSGHVYEWSIAEMTLVETMNTPQLWLTNGFLQPLQPLFILTPELYVTPPNLLSPDGDGYNDVWVIKDLDRYEENELIIVDRAGRVVYKVKNYQNDWTGTLQGSPLAEDTYFYILILKKNNQSATQRGFISIIR